MRLKQKILIALKTFVFFLLCACSEFYSPKEDIALSPTSISPYRLFPNDAAQNDSAAAYLANGLALFVAPGGEYTLSFETEEKLPELQLHRLYQKNGRYYTNLVRKISAKRKDARAVYSFRCESNNPSIWVSTLLGESGKMFDGKIRNIKFEGEGIYPEKFSLNLVALGEYTGTSDSLSLEELSRALLKAFRKEYRGIEIDTIYLSKASENPNAEKNFQTQNAYTDPYEESTNYSSLTTWSDSGRTSALEFILVHQIDSPGLLGYSPLYGVSMADSGQVVLLATHTRATKGLFQLAAEEILATALHEAGHFFGLRHTTATYSEILSGEDLSNTDDGIDDTPHCSTLLLAKTSARARLLAETAQAQIACPDEPNLMYPLSSEIEQTLTDGQLEIIKKNLTLIRH